MCQPAALWAGLPIQRECANNKHGVGEQWKQTEAES